MGSAWKLGLNSLCVTFLVYKMRMVTTMSPSEVCCEGLGDYQNRSWSLVNVQYLRVIFIVDLWFLSGLCIHEVMIECFPGARNSAGFLQTER